jgi:hypothetical protein
MRSEGEGDIGVSVCVWREELWCVGGGSLVECTTFAWGCVVWYNVWYDAEGISCAEYAI